MALDKLGAYLASCGRDHVVLSLAEIATIEGRSLPDSVMYPAFWSNSSHYARAWRGAGYRASRRGVSPDQVIFIREQKSPVSGRDADPSPARAKLFEAAADVILVGCVKTKADRPMPARDLYISAMFRKRRDYAEASVRPWFVLSAEHGLLTPDTLVAPYDTYLAGQSPDYRHAWGDWVVANLVRRIGPLDGLIIEIHAGAAYADAIRRPLERQGAHVVCPLEGLSQGEQLAWYARPAAGGKEEGEPRPPVGASLAISPAEPSGPFPYRWPGSTEHFDCGWDLTVTTGTDSYRVRHGLARRQVYGRQRRHSVTFVDRQPVVEGVAADDYDITRRLVSPIKDPSGRLVRSLDETPAPYADFTLVDHKSAIDAPHSRDAVAVELADDDAAGWGCYAVARLLLRRRPDPLPIPRTLEASPSQRQPSNASGLRSHEDIVRSLLAYSDTHRGQGQGPPSFTPDPVANAFLIDNPFAFLLGVLFDQGIIAERAWSAPYELRKRLGHLDPNRMLSEPDRIHAAVAQPPTLHRYIKILPGWVIKAADIVNSRYAGDAATIWNDQPTARDLFDRLDAFPGIGQKKAAMAVEILERTLGVPIREVSGSDIAYDVHVRRVFLRTGLADRDDLDHMRDVARTANPQRPGALDLPAWLIGRQWCHAGTPDCATCPLTESCPKLIDRAQHVRGA